MENREAVLVLRAIKVPVASADGTRLEIRQFQPGQLLKRSDFDRFPVRSKRSMVGSGTIRDPLNVEINQLTGTADALPPPAPARVKVNSYTVERVHKDGRVYQKRIEGHDRKAQAMSTVPQAPTEPPKRKRGRPRKVKV